MEGINNMKNKLTSRLKDISDVIKTRRANTKSGKGAGGGAMAKKVTESFKKITERISGGLKKGGESPSSDSRLKRFVYRILNKVKREDRVVIQPSLCIPTPSFGVRPNLIKAHTSSESFKSMNHETYSDDEILSEGSLKSFKSVLSK